MKRLTYYPIHGMTILFVLASACSKRSDINQNSYQHKGQMNNAELKVAQPEEMGMKSPREGANAPIFLLFGELEGSGH